MVRIDQLVAQARKAGASDIHLRDGLPAVLRLHGSLEAMPDAEVLDQAAISAYAREMLGARAEESDFLRQDVDFCYAAPDGTRQRVNLFRQDGRLSAAVRLLSDVIPTIDALGLPPALHTLAEAPRGLVLVTGPTGSGKSTTLAAMIDEINSRRRCHILTLEDPVEYKYQMKGALINQREVGVDVDNFADALRSALREDPDVILVGEMRDFETIGAAITAAETGHLVFSTLHTIGAASTIDRVIDVFPAAQQSQVRTQLSSVLKGVITQQLLPRCDIPGRVAATEVMIATDAICNLIRESKTHQMTTSLQTGAALGMHTLNMSLGSLVARGMISRETALTASSDKEDLMRILRTA